MIQRRPEWWNGRHGGLKIRCSKGRVGSTPTSGTLSPAVTRRLEAGASAALTACSQATGIQWAPWSVFQITELLDFLAKLLPLLTDSFTKSRTTATITMTALVIGARSRGLTSARNKPTSVRHATANATTSLTAIGPVHPVEPRGREPQRRTETREAGGNEAHPRTAARQVEPLPPAHFVSASGDVFERLDLPRLEHVVADRVAAGHHEQLAFKLTTVLQHDEDDPAGLGRHRRIDHIANASEVGEKPRPRPGLDLSSRQSRGREGPATCTVSIP